MVEAEEVPPPVSKPRLIPRREKDKEVGIGIERMCIVMLGILTDGNEGIVRVPRIEGPIERGIDGVGPMVLKDSNVDIKGMPLVPLIYGIEGSTTLDKTFGPDMVGGFLTKQKGSLKISLTWTSRGASGSIKGRFKFGGGISWRTSTSTKPISSNQI
jgi:hypothetical protein